MEMLAEGVLWLVLVLICLLCPPFLSHKTRFNAVYHPKSAVYSHVHNPLYVLIRLRVYIDLDQIYIYMALGR